MNTEAKVGIFVVVSLLALAGVIYYIRNVQVVRGQVVYKTHLRYAGGLDRGSYVLFGGIKVGQVKSVHPLSEDPTKIEIVFEVQTGTPLNADSRARVGMISLMSSPALSITTGSNTARRLKPGEVVPSEEAISIEEVTKRFAVVAETANSLLVELRRELPELTGQARTFLANLNQITGPQNQKQIDMILAEMNKLLQRESPKIAQITTRLSELAKHADGLVVSAQPVVTSANQAVANINSTVDAIRAPLVKDLEELERTIVEARTLLVTTQDILRGNEEDVAETLYNLRTTSENVRSLSESLKQRPWSLFRVKQPPDRKVPE